MKGKVKCTCGWSWNKSDSSKKDMYVCHECGRDNSNNMKNGGDISQAKGGEEIISSKQKRGIELQLKELKKEQEDKKQLYTTGQIKNPKSISYKKQKENLEKKKTYVNQDNRTDYEREYDREKGQAEEDKKQFKKNILTPVDVITDLMQLGNFIPHPIAQSIGGIGNAVGVAVDAYQAYDDVVEGNYGSAAINAASTILPTFLGGSGYTRNMYNTNPGSFADDIASLGNRSGNYIPLTTLPYAIAPSTIKGVNFNRSLLGTLGAETIYDIPKQKNGGWLDNYNDSEVSLPEGFVGEGTFNGPKFDNPAWGGQFQNGGTKKQISESTNVYKKPFNKKELKNIIKDDTEKTRTGDIKNPRAEANKFEKYLPTKETIDFFQNLKKENTPAQFREALKIQQERGNPAINVGTDKGLPFANKRNYNPFTNEINIPKPSEYKSNMDNYITEVGHAGQPLSEVIPRFLKNDIPGYIKAYTSKGTNKNNIDKYVYDNPNAVENYTHSKIQPELENRIYSSYSWLRPKEEESDFLEYTRQSLSTPKYQMGGNLPGVVGNMYARTGSPSKGPRRNQTDVTDASAQNGKEMQYYQNGLDWKPKSISRDGSVIKDDRGQWAKNKKNLLSLQPNWLSKFE